MVPPSSHRVPRVRRYSGSSCPSFHFAYETFTLFRVPSHTLRLWSEFALLSKTPGIFLSPVWPVPISLATTFGISFDFFSSPYLDVSVQAVPLVYLCVQYTMLKVCFSGLLHSDIHGSMPACGSPWLFAARCVLRRLPVPRHSPCALCSLTCLVSHVFLIILRYFSSFALMAFAISLFSLTFASVPRRFL